MEKKKFKLGLFPKLIIAIIIGILFGQFLPVWFCRIVVTLSSIFSTFLSFIIPLMILAYVTMGIANLKAARASCCSSPSFWPICPPWRRAPPPSWWRTPCSPAS